MAGETRTRTYWLAADGKGRHAAYSEVEPAFWVERNSEEVAIAAAEAIFADYYKRFGRKPRSAKAPRSLTINQFETTKVQEVA